MQELEKILEEIEIRAIKDLEEENDRCSTTCKGCCSDVKERKCNCRDAIIVRAFKKLAKCMNDGWISVEEQLPEDGSRVLAVIKHHKWIADYDSSWVPECEKTQHPEYTEVCESIASEEGWTYRCHEMDYEVDEAYIKPKRDIANPISEVIAWRPLPEPYRPERSEGE